MPDWFDVHDQRGCELETFDQQVDQQKTRA
jgi:hypothetical protein